MGSHHEIFSSPPSSPEAPSPVKTKVTKGNKAMLMGGIIGVLGLGYATYESIQTHTDEDISKATTTEIAQDMKEYNDEQWEQALYGAVVTGAGAVIFIRGAHANITERDRVNPLPNQDPSSLSLIFK